MENNEIVVLNGHFGSPIEHVRLMGGFTYLDPELTKTKSGGNDGHTAVAVPKIRLSLEQSGILK